MPEKQGAFPAALLWRSHSPVRKLRYNLLHLLRPDPAGSAGGVCCRRRPGGRVPRHDRAAARLLHRRQRVHLHHRKSLGLRRPAARFSRRSPRKRQGQARPALTPAPIIPVPESAVNPAPAGSSSLAALSVHYKILMLWRLFVPLMVRNPQRPISEDWNSQENRTPNMPDYATCACADSHRLRLTSGGR